ncbi:hypothetical protein [Candidatus Phytoplasma ziziphi]|uniref:hypothetical protein n=1 Tax=Candidatus Phytoplasma TaxID=33926 RepID=UPI001375052D|nr:hypothetical protein [Candidatus Phytoplasma ziziphi]
MAIQNINNNTLKRKRIRISKKGSFILLGVCSLLIIVLGSYFYMTTKPQIETNIL